MLDNSSLNIEFDNIKCKIHLKKFLSLNPKNFQIYCKGCEVKEMNLGFDNLSLETDKRLSQDKVLVRYCYKHKEDEALFFCNDCSEFVCNTCFATDHRNHNSSTFELCAKIVKDDLNKTLSELNTLKKNVELNLQSAQELNNYFISQKNTFNKNLKDTSDRIFSNLNFKAKELSEEIENIFNGIDFEVESSSLKLESTKKKANKMLNEFQSFYKDIESMKSYNKVCLYKKEKDEILKENIKFLSDLQFFLNENLEKTKMKSLKEIENFSIKYAKFEKNAEIYENSVINTIVSGIPNICMRLRRFKKFYFLSTKYFKRDSICMLTSQTINLVGFSICGLFHNKNNADSNNSLNTLKLGFKLYEVENDSEFNSNLPTVNQIEIEVPVILNVIDPVYQFYLKNAVSMSKDKLYYLLIENLSDNKYVDIWSGEVEKDKDKDNIFINQHSVVCNNSCVRINFINAEGVESDLNEFTGGILCDIIFSQLDY